MSASVRSIDIARARARRKWGIPVTVREKNGNSWSGRPIYIKRVGRLLSIERGASGITLYEIIINGDPSSYFYFWNEFRFLGRITETVVYL